MEDNDVEMLIELYQVMIQYVPNKDKQEMADHLMSTLVDVLSDADLKEFSGVDSYLKKAFKEYNNQEADFDEDDE